MSFQGILRVLRAVGLLIVAILSYTAVSSAAPPRWEKASPFGGSIASLVQAPSAPRILYAAALNGSVFRSFDDGATWHRRWGGSIGDYRIAELFVDPLDAQTVYARTDFPEPYRSRDGGATWTPIGPETRPVSAFALDRDHPGILFAAAANGLYRSDDGGDSWVLVTLGGSFVDGVAVDPRDTNTIFAAVDGAYTEEPSTVWKSTDRGATWTSAVLPQPQGFDAGIAHFVFDPVRPETLYLFYGRDYSSGSPVLRSTDGGASWSVIPTVAGISGLIVLPEGTLFVATALGLGRSDDGGATWVPPLDPGFPAGPPLDVLTQLLVSAAVPGALFAAGSSGIWKSGDKGASWALSNHGIQAQGAYEVDVAPTGPPAVYALAGVSLFRSADQGDTWARLHSLFDGPQPFAIEVIDPRHPRTIYGIDTDGQAGFPVVSRDRGSHWTRLPIPYNCDGGDSVCDVQLTAIALDLSEPETILVGGSYFFHFQGTGSFLLRSADGGETWQELAPVARISDLVVDPGRRDTYHAVSCGGYFRSRNAGAAWQKTGSGLPEDLCARDARTPVLVIDPQDPRKIYVNTLSQGVFASSDGGATFRSMHRGLETVPVVTLLIDPTDSSKLYAGALERGVFRWNAKLRKWTPLNRGLPLSLFEGAIALDPRHPSILYAASPVAGVFRLDLDDSAP